MPRHNQITRFGANMAPYAMRLAAGQLAPSVEAGYQLYRMGKKVYKVAKSYARKKSPPKKNKRKAKATARQFEATAAGHGVVTFTKVIGSYGKGKFKSQKAFKDAIPNTLENFYDNAVSTVQGSQILTTTQSALSSNDFCTMSYTTDGRSSVTFPFDTSTNFHRLYVQHVQMKSEFTNITSVPVVARFFWVTPKNLTNFNPEDSVAAGLQDKYGSPINVYNIQDMPWNNPEMSPQFKSSWNVLYQKEVTFSPGEVVYFDILRIYDQIIPDTKYKNVSTAPGPYGADRIMTNMFAKNIGLKCFVQLRGTTVWNHDNNRAQFSAAKLAYQNRTITKYKTWQSDQTKSNSHYILNSVPNAASGQDNFMEEDTGVSQPVATVS